MKLAQSGYSGTPLVKKLGIKEGTEIVILNQPSGYLVDELWSGLKLVYRLKDR
jgi:hypothetical protein